MFPGAVAFEPFIINRKELGSYLTYFGAEEDLIFLNELREIEPLAKKMDNKLSYQYKKNPSAVLALRDIVPTIHNRIDKYIMALLEYRG